mmetsp:Transcript_54333/g.141992  ORF Transcript_54333/g.141992 Transcript_54333/m.141992 type:complete len:546 (-) Transcript_54333:452-2089(-)
MLGAVMCDTDLWLSSLVAGCFGAAAAAAAPAAAAAATFAGAGAGAFALADVGGEVFPVVAATTVGQIIHALFGLEGSSCEDLAVGSLAAACFSSFARAAVPFDEGSALDGSLSGPVSACGAGRPELCGSWLFFLTAFAFRESSSTCEPLVVGLDCWSISPPPTLLAFGPPGLVVGGSCASLVVAKEGEPLAVVEDRPLTGRLAWPSRSTTCHAAGSSSGSSALCAGAGPAVAGRPLLPVPAPPPLLPLLPLVHPGCGCDCGCGWDCAGGASCAGVAAATVGENCCLIAAFDRCGACAVAVEVATFPVAIALAAVGWGESVGERPLTDDVALAAAGEVLLPTQAPVLEVAAKGAERGAVRSGSFLLSLGGGWWSTAGAEERRCLGPPRASPRPNPTEPWAPPDEKELPPEPPDWLPRSPLSPAAPEPPPPPLPDCFGPRARLPDKSDSSANSSCCCNRAFRAAFTVEPAAQTIRRGTTMTNQTMKRAPFQGKTTKTSLKSPAHCLATAMAGFIDFLMALDLLVIPAKKIVLRQIMTPRSMTVAIRD